MANSPEERSAPQQSGAKVGLGILAFVAGLFILLWIVKVAFGF